ncbi:MAG: hypothetical protein ACRCX2_15245, partial [Paraclostridium sp.]
MKVYYDIFECYYDYCGEKWVGYEKTLEKLKKQNVFLSKKFKLVEVTEELLARYQECEDNFENLPDFFYKREENWDLQIIDNLVSASFD